MGKLGGAIGDLLMGTIFPTLKAGAVDVMEEVERRAIALQERAVRRLAIVLVNGVAIVFLLFSLFYYLIEFRGMYRTHVFLYLGVALLLISFFMKYQLLKEQTR